MIGNFQACLAFTERPDIEGLKCDDDPHDPGGRTYRGIEQTEYDAWNYLHHVSTGDVCKAQPAVLSAIYEHSYWQPYCDLLPKGADLMHFDTAVNEGPVPAVTFLQRALKIHADGHFGVVTAASVRQCIATGGVKSLISNFANERRAAYHRMKQFGRYGEGWLDRVSKCEQAALEMANGVDTAPKVVA